MSKHILIIEDDVVSRDLLRLVFEYDGFHCTEAANGAIGLDLMDSFAFDAIILDNAMPVMTGLEFLAKKKARPNKFDPPVIMITGCVSPEVHEEAETLGAYTIVGKPFDMGKLRSLVAHLCHPSTPSPQEFFRAQHQSGKTPLSFN